VKDGEHSVGKNEPLFRVTLIRISSCKCALFFSLSHVIADGHTYYSLYSMLCSTISPRALIVQRKLDFDQQLDTAMNGNDAYSWCFTLGATINIIKTLLFAKKPKVLLIDLPLSKIESEKEKYISSLSNNNSNQSPPPFLSSNDIITSWYFKRCQCDMGIMNMNFRHRFPELTDDHAGNYEGLIAYQPNDFQYPYLIRQSLPLYHRVNKDIALPSFWSAIQTKVALISSWTTFYHEIQIPNAHHISHFPYFENRKIAFADFTIIFRPRAKELQLLSITRSFEQESLFFY
jgi:hypothetical protein